MVDEAVLADPFARQHTNCGTVGSGRTGELFAPRVNRHARRWADAARRAGHTRTQLGAYCRSPGEQVLLRAIRGTESQAPRGLLLVPERGSARRACPTGRRAVVGCGCPSCVARRWT